MTHPETYPALQRAVQRSRELDDRLLLLERLRKDIEWYETFGDEHAALIQTLRETHALVSGPSERHPIADDPQI